MALQTSQTNVHLQKQTILIFFVYFIRADSLASLQTRIQSRQLTNQC